jgi:hypothetical protein
MMSKTSAVVRSVLLIVSTLYIYVNNVAALPPFYQLSLAVQLLICRKIGRRG